MKWLLHLWRFRHGVAVAATVAALIFTGGRMFSPGALNQQNHAGSSLGGVWTHADLASNCSACHASPWSGVTMADRCLECHVNVQRQILAGEPLHGRFAPGADCRPCHLEHRGSDAALTNLQFFDHNCAAFALTGRHRSLDCNACHKTRAYRGLPRTCVGCHAEPTSHAGKFGTDCATCHATTTWRDAALDRLAGGTFDHDRTNFPLTGQHRSVDCKACHSNGTFPGTPTSCVSCHAEPKVPKVHRARYGLNCAQCHSTASFQNSTFRHTFPVDHHAKGPKGAKMQPGNVCANCHNNPGNLAEYTCFNCHAHEPTKMRRRHPNRLLGDVKLEHCATCHKTDRRHRRKLAGASEDDAVLASVLAQVAARYADRFIQCDAALSRGCDEEIVRTWPLLPRGVPECVGDWE